MSDFKIDFVVAGFQKCGTSALADFLMRHPEINFCQTKEPVYFVPSAFEQKSPSQYASLYRTEHPGRKGEASTAYAFPRNAAFSAQKIHEHNPDLRLVFVLRNPINRVRSTVRHAQLNQSGPFTPEWQESRVKRGIEDSAYATVLLEYLKYFGRNNILLVKFEDLIAERALADICRFLEISENCEMSLHKVNYTGAKGNNPWWFQQYRKYHEFILRLPFSSNMRKLGRKLMRKSGRSGKPKEELLDLTEAQVAKVQRELVDDCGRFEREFGFSYFELKQ